MHLLNLFFSLFLSLTAERSQAQTNTQTKPQTNRGVVGSSYISPNSAAPQSSNHLSHSFDLACQNRGRYGPKQHLVECTGNTGSNLVHIRGVENNPPVPANENGENNCIICILTLPDMFRFI